MSSLPYSLHRSMRRTLSVEVHPDGAVHVRAPLRMSEARIEAFVRDRMDWIVTKLSRSSDIRSVVPPLELRQFHHRGRVMSWGTDSAVRRPTIRLNQSDGIPQLLLPATLPPERLELAVRRWQRSEAENVFGVMINETMPILGLASMKFRELRLRRMTRRWGSCSTGGVITLNERLIEVPDDCIRAVVVHEMCHLVHMNHGQAFHRLVRDVMPDHQSADTLLDRWSVVLSEERNTRRRPSTAVASELRRIALERRYAEVLAQISSNADVSDAAIISGVRPSM